VTAGRALLLAALVGCQGAQNQQSSSLPDTSAAISNPAAVGIAPATTCGDDFIGAEGIGKLSIGAPLDSIRASCRIIRDTIVLADEGQRARRVTVSLPADTVVAEIVAGRVWRIEVNSPRFRTRDSLGVGTPIARLLALEDPRGANGEGRFYVLSPDHCGLSFRLSEGWPGTLRHPIDRAKLSQVPRTTTVSTVLITGCPND
jgi:hypothetical protein